ncbi:hypothetical protein JTE90_002021 [Oedothorax gibbosus]|uniref:Uncharacterized protein n=1 Tax=Oedothorax gibbosus TaxID=931172 RepID=A0AAV6UQE3_9ARAC|nr:hypothetical protein JTE90_002021 [Oedothorax gibbosus]
MMQMHDSLRHDQSHDEPLHDLRQHVFDLLHGLLPLEVRQCPVGHMTHQHNHQRTHPHSDADGFARQHFGEQTKEQIKRE